MWHGGALEQPQPMLELRYTELELGNGFTRSGAELGAETRAHGAGGFTQPLQLSAPALEHVDEDGAGFLTVDAETLRQLVRETVHPVRSQSDDADSGERERLERAPGRLRPRSGRL
ncbi:MAG: hypothetical protein H0W31_00890 [Actinobacteria bacterium]|nr:hypothetical protein [Actinomycetota bacterium]